MSSQWAEKHSSRGDMETHSRVGQIICLQKKNLETSHIFQIGFAK